LAKVNDSDRNFWNEAFEDYPEQVMVVDRIIDGEIQQLTVTTALDLGCGRGTNALALAKQGWSITGVDWSEKAIELAISAAAEQGLEATFVVDDTSVWQPNQKFDLVISTYALPGGESSQKVLQTAVKALAPGGILMVAEWDRSMAKAWGFDDDELPTPEQIVAWLPGLLIKKAEVRRIKDMFSGTDDPRASAGHDANIAFVKAQNPLHES
jgi:2-polyprenyl-3-methyl-5-hydroxy-6-metoxy-1,4-benzoquinol methylase